MNELEKSYYDAMFLARYPTLGNPVTPKSTAKIIDYDASGRRIVQPDSPSSALPIERIIQFDSSGLRDENFNEESYSPSGSINEIPRNFVQRTVGRLGAMIEGLAEKLDSVGMKFKIPGTNTEVNPTLKDVTVGDLGKVLSDASYGFYPTRGAGATKSLTPDAVELLNVPVIGAPAVATGKAVAKTITKAVK